MEANLRRTAVLLRPFSFHVRLTLLSPGHWTMHRGKLGTSCHQIYDKKDTKPAPAQRQSELCHKLWTCANDIEEPLCQAALPQAGLTSSAPSIGPGRSESSLKSLRDAPSSTKLLLQHLQVVYEPMTSLIFSSVSASFFMLLRLAQNTQKSPQRRAPPKRPKTAAGC